MKREVWEVGKNVLVHWFPHELITCIVVARLSAAFSTTTVLQIHQGNICSWISARNNAASIIVIFICYIIIEPSSSSTTSFSTAEVFPTDNNISSRFLVTSWREILFVSGRSFWKCDRKRHRLVMAWDHFCTPFFSAFACISNHSFPVEDRHTLWICVRVLFLGVSSHLPSC